jgi:uncharacterized protein YkwD
MVLVFGAMLARQGLIARTAANGASAREREMELELIELINRERAENEMKPLEENEALSRAARAKLAQVGTKDGFSHYSSLYGDPFDLMESYGLVFSAAGENLARREGSARETLDDWMNSRGHRNNILNPIFDYIGVAAIPDLQDGWLWAAMFMDDIED